MRWPFALAAVAWAAMIAHGGGSCCHGASFASELAAWMGMIVAMMVPTLGEGMRDVSLRSYRTRRHRAVAMYLLGYLAWWAAAGIAFSAARGFEAMRTPAAAVAAFAVAALWMLLPVRARWHVLCHRRIALTPVGARADLDAARQGALNGAPCVASCLPLMVACALTNHALVAMLGGAALTVVEKRMFRLRRFPLALGAAALACWAIACTR